MAPHATSPPRMSGDSRSNRHEDQAGSEAPNQRQSMLPASNQDELFDLICVGLGPSSLAIAAALHDAVEFQPEELVGFDGRLPKICFLEQQEHFAWHSGMQLPGAKMQISWMKDLASMRNPRSQFTFMNYLHSVGRLVTFSNLGTFLPLRIEFEDYLRWCADWFSHLTIYEQECLEVSPERENAADGQVHSFKVSTRNLRTRQIETRRAKRVVIAVGGKPKMPDCVPHRHSKVLHSSGYRWTIPKALPDQNASYKVVVLGAGQSAAEVFNDLHSRYPNSSTFLVVKGSALKPSDDSPFVNEVFDPERIDHVYAESPEIRSADIKEDKPTNYGVVRLELLEKLYGDLYEQQIRHPNPDDRPHHILTHHSIVGFDQSESSEKVRVVLEDRSGEHSKCQSPATTKTMDVDAVVVAAGYSRNAHEDFLMGARDMMPGGDKEGKMWGVRRDYAVEFAEGTVATDAGVWLQGCNEDTHGISDTLLSVLATRGGEMVHSLFGGPCQSVVDKVNGDS